MASSILVLVLLSFLLTAAQSGDSGVPHNLIEARGLPRGIFPRPSGGYSFSPHASILVVNLLQDSCTLNFSSEVSELVYEENPIKTIIDWGKVEFNSLVVMRLGPTASDIRPLRKIVSPSHPLNLTLEFWSTDNDLAATVSPSAFSQERPCVAQSVGENPGATINLAKA